MIFGQLLASYDKFNYTNKPFQIKMLRLVFLLAQKVLHKELSRASVKDLKELMRNIDE